MASINLKMGVDNAQFKTGLEQAKGKAKDFKKTVRRALGSAFAIMGVGMAVRKVVAGIDTITEKYDRLAKLSKAHGNISTEFFQKAAFVAEQSGTSVESVAKGMDTLLMSTRMAAQGSKLYADAFKNLNINVKEFQDLDQEGKFKAIADAVKFSADQDRAKADVMQLMGKRAGELIPMLREGAKGFEAIGDQVSILDDSSLRDIENFRDAVNELKAAFVSLAATKLPVILIEAMSFFEAVTNLEREGKGFWHFSGGLFGIGGSSWTERLEEERQNVSERLNKQRGLSTNKANLLNRLNNSGLKGEQYKNFSKKIDEAETTEQLIELFEPITRAQRLQGARLSGGSSQNITQPTALGDDSKRIFTDMLEVLREIEQGQEYIPAIPKLKAEQTKPQVDPIWGD